MIQLERCEDIINYLLLTGGKLVSDKSQGTEDFGGRTVNIVKDACNIKIGYLNMGKDQLVVEKMCCCSGADCWKMLNMVCLDK